MIGEVFIYIAIGLSFVLYLYDELQKECFVNGCFDAMLLGLGVVFLWLPLLLFMIITNIFFHFVDKE